MFTKTKNVLRKVWDWGICIVLLGSTLVFPRTEPQKSYQLALPVPAAAPAFCTNESVSTIPGTPRKRIISPFEVETGSSPSYRTSKILFASASNAVMSLNDQAGTNNQHIEAAAATDWFANFLFDRLKKEKLPTGTRTDNQKIRDNVILYKRAKHVETVQEVHRRSAQAYEELTANLQIKRHSGVVVSANDLTLEQELKENLNRLTTQLFIVTEALDSEKLKIRNTEMACINERKQAIIDAIEKVYKEKRDLEVTSQLAVGMPEQERAKIELDRFNSLKQAIDRQKAQDGPIQAALLEACGETPEMRNLKYDRTNRVVTHLRRTADNSRKIDAKIQKESEVFFPNRHEARLNNADPSEVQKRLTLEEQRSEEQRSEEQRREARLLKSQRRIATLEEGKRLRAAEEEQRRENLEQQKRRDTEARDARAALISRRRASMDSAGPSTQKIQRQRRQSSVTPTPEPEKTVNSPYDWPGLEHTKEVSRREASLPNRQKAINNPYSEQQVKQEANPYSEQQVKQEAIKKEPKD